MESNGKSLRPAGRASVREMESEGSRQGTGGAAPRFGTAGHAVLALGLRERAFLDSEPSPRDLPKDLVQHLENIHDEICAIWDDMYPHNPVTSKDNEDD